MKNRNITLGKKGNKQTSQEEKYRKTLDFDQKLSNYGDLEGIPWKEISKKLINIFIGPDYLRERSNIVTVVICKKKSIFKRNCKSVPNWA